MTSSLLYSRLQFFRTPALPDFQAIDSSSSGSSLANPGQFLAKTSNDFGSVFAGNSCFNLPTGDMHLTFLFLVRIRLKQSRHVFFSKDLLQSVVQLVDL